MSAEKIATPEPVKHVSRLQGHVVSVAMDKSIVVSIIRKIKHPRYKKYIKQTTKVMAHDQENQCTVGDLVDIVESRPMSKRKSWALDKIIKRAE